MLQLRFATTNECELIQQLAKQIWEPTYGHILLKEQLDYMFEMMYSVEAIKNQMEALQHKFYIAYVEENPVGYLSIGYDGKHVFKLHKLYVLPDMHGSGVGNFLLQQAVMHVKQQFPDTICALQLNVNRHNKRALAFYHKMGFEQIGEGDFNIGNNYFMNDYIMEYLISGNE